VGLGFLPLADIPTHNASLVSFPSTPSVILTEIRTPAGRKDEWKNPGALSRAKPHQGVLPG
jgi:hypothetical protein